MKQTCDQLIPAIQRLADRGLCPGTGGNFSARLSESEFLITRSGADKAALSNADFVRCSFALDVLDGDGKASAEAALHSALYEQFPDIQAVFHTHSVAATVLSRLSPDCVCFQGYEMQKSINGFSSHEERLELPVYENTQDIQSLAATLCSAWRAAQPLPGFVLRGHGLYAWGGSIAEGLRHVEGFEFLLESELQYRLIGGRAL